MFTLDQRSLNLISKLRSKLMWHFGYCTQIQQPGPMAKNEMCFGWAVQDPLFGILAHSNGAAPFAHRQGNPRRKLHSPDGESETRGDPKCPLPLKNATTAFRASLSFPSSWVLGL